MKLIHNSAQHSLRFYLNGHNYNFNQNRALGIKVALTNPHSSDPHSPARAYFFVSSHSFQANRSPLSPLVDNEREIHSFMNKIARAFFVPSALPVLGVSGLPGAAATEIYYQSVDRITALLWPSRCRAIWPPRNNRRARQRQRE